MSNLEKYTKIFTESFEVDAEKAKTLKYQDVKHGILSDIWI